MINDALRYSSMFYLREKSIGGARESMPILCYSLFARTFAHVSKRIRSIYTSLHYKIDH